MSDDWDVDSYRSEFESEDHWELRRSFMLAHKDKFPEDELVCLAQVFTNIEFLGCRYPDKTMMRVAELAKGVVEKFRDQRKNSLKRTFVAASDAASAKVKGQNSKGEEPVSFKKIKKTNQSEPNSKEVNTPTIILEKSDKNKAADTRIPKYGGVKTFNINQPESNNKIEEIQSTSKADGEITKKPLGNFVLVLRCPDEHPINIIQRNCSLNKCTMRWEIKEMLGATFACKLYLNDHCIATSTGSSTKMSKEHTAMVAIAKLREHYYGIRIKSKYISDSTVSPAQLGTSGDKPTDQLGEDNIGRKLMKLMGWEGGGLGTRGQGRENPITPALHVKRDGLGLKSNTSNMIEFKKRAKDYVKDWMKSNSNKDLVFSSFSVEERKILHEIAMNFSLKSKSYGKEPNREVVISRKIEPYEILKELLKTGEDTERYELLHPTNI